MVYCLIEDYIDYIVWGLASVHPSIHPTDDQIDCIFVQSGAESLEETGQMSEISRDYDKSEH